MGDPRKHRAKYSVPKKAWEKERIDEEKELIKKYHFKNKSEIWKQKSKLRNFARQAKRLITLHTEQAEKEKIQILTKLKSLGLIDESGGLADVLGITSEDLFNRRLQSIVFKKGLARSMKQARQFIVHRHVLIGDKKVTSPNYLVKKAEESSVNFSNNSPFIDEMHPERKQEEKLPKKLAKEETKKEEKEGKGTKGKKKGTKPAKKEKKAEKPKSQNKKSE